MSKRLVFDIEKCVGCRACELACSFKHEGVFNPKRSRIRITSIYPAGLDIPISCHHCEDMKCADACPQDAIVRDTETGAVVIDTETCIGCKACLTGCPIRALFWNPENRTVIKCDLCGGDPTCVKYCAHGALDVVDDQEDVVVKQDILQEFLKGNREDIYRYFDKLEILKQPEQER